MSSSGKTARGVCRMLHPGKVAGQSGARCTLAEIRGLLLIVARHTDRPNFMCMASAGRWGIPNHHQWMLLRGHTHNISREGCDVVDL